VKQIVTHFVWILYPIDLQPCNCESCNHFTSGTVTSFISCQQRNRVKCHTD